MFPQEHPVSSKKPTPRSLISLPVYLPWKGDAFKFPVVLPWKRVLRRRKLSVPDVAGFLGIHTLGAWRCPLSGTFVVFSFKTASFSQDQSRLPTSLDKQPTSSLGTLDV